MKKLFTFILLPFTSFAQFEPQVGESGSTAISKDTNAIVAWAKSGTAFVGYKDIANPSLGRASVGVIDNALGKAGTNGVISLGDAGVAILTFFQPIQNGPGADFAVFENGFRELNTNLDYLEYAFVEVSSDGINYFRFPAEYVGDTSVQISSFQTTNTTLYHNLAGKYWANYGTPFDLEELKGNPGLNVDNITHVKIVDVVGTLNKVYTSRDSRGRKINDPYPTDFGSGGFDLDAVGVIHQAGLLGLGNSFSNSSFRIYPNPASEFISVKAVENTISKISVSELSGIKLLEWNDRFERMDISSLSAGVYLIEVQNSTSTHIERLIINN